MFGELTDYGICDQQKNYISLYSGGKVPCPVRGFLSILLQIITYIYTSQIQTQMPFEGQTSYRLQTYGP